MPRPKLSSATIALHAVLAGLLCALPHGVAMVSNGGDYTPFSVSPAVSAITFDETHAYAPPARRFMETGKICPETDNFERRNSAGGIPFFPAVTLGLLGWITGGLSRAFVLADAVFPALLFILLYRIAGQVVDAPSLRLLVAWSTMIVPFGVMNFLWMGDDALVVPLEVTRTPQPEISFTVLMATVILLGAALRRDASWWRTVAAGIASGAIVYCYYYYAIAWGLALGLLFLLGLVWKLAPVWSRAATAALCMVGCAVPFVLETAKGRAQGGQTDLLERMGAFTHRVDVLALVAAIAALAILAAFGRNLCSKQPLYFALALLLAGALLGMNVQVISGYETQPWHFWKRLALPIAFLLAASAAAYAAQQLRIRRQLAGLLLALVVVSAGLRLTVAGLRMAPYQRASDPAHALLSWIHVYLPRDRVIGTVDPELILLLPALTTDYTYVPSGLRSLTSTKEIVERFDELACIVGLTKDEVAQETNAPNHLGHSSLLLQTLGLTYTGDRAVFEWFVRQYGSYSEHCPAAIYRKLDYVVVPANRALPKGREIYVNARYRLYEWKNDRTASIVRPEEAAQISAGDGS